MQSLSLLKKTFAGGVRISAIAVLSACTTIHPETISQNLGPEAQGKFQSDYTECHEFAESKRPKISFTHDIALPLGVALVLTGIGLAVEHDVHNYDGDYGVGEPKYDGMVALGFSLAGVLTATGIVVAGMISRQHDQDAALRACLYERGYTVL